MSVSRRAVLLRLVALLASAVLHASESRGDGSTNASSCAQTFCRKGKMCVESKIGEVITAECTCPVNCSNVHRPVCSVYHVEFPNICELHKFACANEMHIQVKHQGNCSEQEASSACRKSQIINFQDKWLQRIFPVYQESRVFSVVERLLLAKRNFDRYWDKDKNGLLTEDEISRIFHERTFLNSACIVGLIRSCDTDRTPGINRQEWYTCFKTEGGEWRWSPWTDCSVTCGGGRQRRTGTCILPSTGQRLRRKLCVGKHHQMKYCSNGMCPGQWRWSTWTDCSVTCGGGRQRRTGTCILPSTGQKLQRERCVGNDYQIRNCSNEVCPGQWRWSPWTDCSVTCGGGRQRRTGTCILPSTGQKLQRERCVGNDYQIRNCSNGVCPGQWRWSPWTDCSVTCGGGRQRRTGTCILPSTGKKLQRERCVGNHHQTRKCVNGECPDWMVSIDTDGKWSRWSSWTDCSRSCGKGRQSRTRVCTNKATGKLLKNGWCAGKPRQEDVCADWKCPDKRKRKCPLDREGTLKGRVLTKRDAPLAGANVSLAESPYKILSRTQENGFFEVNAFCFDKEKVILIIKRGYVPQTFRITDSKSTFKFKMENAVHPTVTAHPEDRRRFVGQDVIFCCQVEGNPPPVIEWFRNENILDSDEFNNKETLLLRKVEKNMAGNFRCRAVNQFGAEFSESATLTVLDPVLNSCNSTPSDHYINLPDGCTDLTGKSKVNIGKCDNSPCIRADVAPKQSCEEEERCCQAGAVSETTVRCGQGEFTVKRIANCRCDICKEGDTIVKGVVVGGPDETPVEYCDILVNDTVVTFSDFDGTFQLTVKKTTKRLVATFRDYTEEYEETTVTLPFQKGTTTFHKIHLRLEAKPIEFDPEEEKVVPLVGDAAAEVVIPANSLIDKDGNPQKGKAKVKVQFSDPRSEQDILESQGDFTTVDEDGEEQLLRTYGLFKIKVQDENNNNLGLTKDLHINIDIEQITGETFNESTPLPHLWWLDQKTGRWVDAGQLERNSESAKRKKRNLQSRAFSGVITPENVQNAYNLDLSYDRCFAKVRATRRDGSGIPNAKVTSIFTNPRGQAIQGYLMRTTSSNGYRCISTQCNSDGYMEVEEDGKPLLPHEHEVRALPPETRASIVDTRRINFNPGGRPLNGPVYQKAQASSCWRDGSGQSYFSFHSQGDAQVFNQGYVPQPPFQGRFGRASNRRRCYLKILTSGTTSTLVTAESYSEDEVTLYGTATKQTERVNSNLYAACIEHRCPERDATLIRFTVLTGECRRSRVQDILDENRNSGLAPNVAKALTPTDDELSGNSLGMFTCRRCNSAGLIGDFETDCLKKRIEDGSRMKFFAVKFTCN